nr:MAG TPA: hypothetical protein [Caudoviricetes sp.]DAM59819.1 MAG TPA: hypothetical protein [Caudoviricetes sp.]
MRSRSHFLLLSFLFCGIIIAGTTIGGFLHGIY